MLVKKLRIYAIIMRLQELDQERIEIRNNRLRAQFSNPPIVISNPRKLIPDPITWFDKKGKPFETPKSKYHK